jgi:hypothetical protein
MGAAELVEGRCQTECSTAMLTDCTVVFEGPPLSDSDRSTRFGRLSVGR